jgi:DNA-binding CsgD family transcriptional regulator
LFNAKRTVTTHIGEIYAKINVRNRAEAVAFAVRWDLV